MTFANAFRAAFGSEARRNRRQLRITARTLRALDDHILRDVGLLGHEVRAARDQRGSGRDFW